MPNPGTKRKAKFFFFSSFFIFFSILEKEYTFTLCVPYSLVDLVLSNATSVFRYYYSNIYSIFQKMTENNPNIH